MQKILRWIVPLLLVIAGYRFYQHTQDNAIENIWKHIDIRMQTGDENLDDVDWFLTGSTETITADPLTHAELFIKRYLSSQDISLIPTIITNLIQWHAYDQAIPYLSLLDQNSTLKNSISVDTVLLALLNGIDLNFKNIETLKDLVQKYHDQGLLSKDQLNLYFALITFTRWDFNNYSFFMDQLSDGQFSWWKLSFKQIQEQYHAFPDAPSSYFDALIAMDIFKRWYVNVAYVNAQRLFNLDTNYILPRQIIAYASIILGKWSTAEEHLTFLITKDPQNQDLYLFLKWVALFQQWKFQESILSFSQVSTERFQKDIQQYLFLMYTELQDWNKLHEVIEKLIHYPLDAQEYLALFHPLLRKNGDLQIWSLLDETMKSSIANLLRKCYQELSAQESYACLYAKAWVMVAQWNEDRSFEALRQLVLYYPQDYLYETLAHISEKKGNILAAKKYMMRAMSTKSTDERKHMQDKVVDLIK